MNVTKWALVLGRAIGVGIVGLVGRLSRSKAGIIRGVNVNNGPISGVGGKAGETRVAGSKLKSTV